jgi:hypothetical protein
VIFAEAMPHFGNEIAAIGDCGNRGLRQSGIASTGKERRFRNDTPI